MQSDEGNQDYVAPWSRVVILVTALLIAGGVSWFLTGSIVPATRQEALIFQSGLLLLVLGSAVIEHKFTKPADSVVNALTGMVTLATVYSVAPQPAWWLVFSYCGLVFLMALTCTLVSTGPGVTGWKERVARWTYGPSVLFGRARLLQSVVFLFGVFSFYETGSEEAAVLVVFWGVFMAIWPLRVPQLLTRMKRGPEAPKELGRVVRREWPDLVRVQLEPGVRWQQDEPRIYQDGDGVQHLVVPLYKQQRDQHSIATGLCVAYDGERIEALVGGLVYEMPGAAVPSQETIASALGASSGSQLLGFVIEDSHIGAIRFETWHPELCRQGLLVWCKVAGQQVFYQVTEGATREESLQADRLGSQYAVAAQMGTLDKGRGFLKCEWLPLMNTPVFGESPSFGGDVVFDRGRLRLRPCPRDRLESEWPILGFIRIPHCNSWSHRFRQD